MGLLKKKKNSTEELNKSPGWGGGWGWGGRDGKGHREKKKKERHTSYKKRFKRQKGTLEKMTRSK